MHRSRVNEKGEPQLPNTIQALYVGMLQYIIYQFIWYRQKPEHRVVNNLSFIRHTIKKRTKVQLFFEIHKKKLFLFAYPKKKHYLCAVFRRTYTNVRTIKEGIMTILSIETSTTVCSAAICKDGAPIKQCIHTEGSNHAKMLPLFIEELLSYARAEGLRIEAVALSEGPGSYTGLRIGTSTAKGLCYGLDIPLIPVPTLEVLKEAFRCQHPEIRLQETDVLFPMIDARRMEVYTEAQRDKGQGTKENNAQAVIVESEEALPCTGAQCCYYFGDGAEKCQAVLKGEKWHFIPGIVPEAQYMGGLVEREKGKSMLVSGADLAYYEPFYLKEFVAAQSHVKGLKS